MHPEGAEAGLRSRPARRLVAAAAADPASVVLPSKALTSVERLDIYAHMYYARLIEVMEAEYPTTRQILGSHAFAVACRRFIDTQSFPLAHARQPEREASGFPRADPAERAPQRTCRRRRANRARDGGRVRRAARRADDGRGVRGDRRGPVGSGSPGRQSSASPAEAPLSIERLHECGADGAQAADPATAVDVCHRLPSRVLGVPARPGTGAIQVARGARLRSRARRRRCARASAGVRAAPIDSPQSSAPGSANGRRPGFSHQGYPSRTNAIN